MIWVKKTEALFSALRRVQGGTAYASRREIARRKSVLLLPELNMPVTSLRGNHASGVGGARVHTQPWSGWVIVHVTSPKQGAGCIDEEMKVRPVHWGM